MRESLMCKYPIMAFSRGLGAGCYWLLGVGAGWEKTRSRSRSKKKIFKNSSKYFFLHSQDERSNLIKLGIYEYNIKIAKNVKICPIIWIKWIITKHNFVKKFIRSIWRTFKCSETAFANLAWYRRTKDLVPLFDPKVHHFENSILKIMAPLIWLSFKLLEEGLVWKLMTILSFQN